MGFLSDLMGGAAKKAAAENKQLYNTNYQTGLGYLDTGKTEGMGYLGQAIGAFDPLAALGKKYGGATDMYLNALGVNGPQGTQAAQQAFQTGPGYQFALDQGTEAAKRLAAGNSQFTSGNTMMGIADYNRNMANQEYNNWLKNFTNFINPELQATAGAAGGKAAGYGSEANLTANDAINRVNLGNTTTSGMANANNQAAAASQAGAGNLLNFGMNLFKLATGIPGFGGGSSYNAG